jgi:hypothetical protein
MKEILTNDRLTIRTMQLGLIRLLLTLMLATASLPAFSARYHAPGTSNTAPVISGTPATSVVAGSSYYFQPTATDANGDRLKFSISNKPAWASFSSKTGQLSGAPGSASVGIYGNIVISVSDRKTSASLPVFSIRVDAATTSGGTTSSGTSSSGSTSSSITSGSTTSSGTTAPAQTGSLTLQWTAPVTRADGTPLSLSDIDGYHIYYGTSAGNYPNRIDVADGTAQATTITDMPVGTYFLVMTTYDVSGLESVYSSMATKYVQ